MIKCAGRDRNRALTRMAFRIKVTGPVTQSASSGRKLDYRLRSRVVASDPFVHSDTAVLIGHALPEDDITVKIDVERPVDRPHKMRVVLPAPVLPTELRCTDLGPDGPQVVPGPIALEVQVEITGNEVEVRMEPAHQRLIPVNPTIHQRLVRRHARSVPMDKGLVVDRPATSTRLILGNPGLVSA